MNIALSALILGIVQGITEWLPISSTGHLALASKIIGFNNNNLSFDIALHLGTLLAVLIYFWKDLWGIIRDFVTIKTASSNWKLAWMLIVASIPAALIGLLFKKQIESSLNNMSFIALAFAITGVVLLFASMDFYYIKNKELGYRKALAIGCAQAVAILPGISRSGSTVSAGLFLGLDEKKAMKFAFLMAVPVILGAGLLSVVETGVSHEFTLPGLIGFISAFIVGLGTLHLFYSKILVTRKNLLWFAVYLILLSIFTSFI